MKKKLRGGRAVLICFSDYEEGRRRGGGEEHPKTRLSKLNQTTRKHDCGTLPKHTPLQAHRHVGTHALTKEKKRGRQKRNTDGDEEAKSLRRPNLQYDVQRRTYEPTEHKKATFIKPTERTSGTCMHVIGEVWSTKDHDDIPE